MADQLHPLETTAHIKTAYLRYLTTTFPLKDSRLREQFIEQIHRPGRLVKGPLLEATPPFQSGRSVRELIRAGLLHSDLAVLESPSFPLDRPLYLHQEEAILKVATGRNVVAATGTGSGKTESFLIPILSELLAQRAGGRLGPGVRALLLYPMNALANDQIKRLRSMVESVPDITFGIYTGETQQTAERAYADYTQRHGRDPLPNERISRAQMQQEPPHILLTNYAMLEYLLIRPTDSELFGDVTGERHWQFVVLDEAHVYDGASGIEVGMLLRRLRHRVAGSREQALRCIATSATLGRGRGDYPAVVSFATSLFGQPFEWVEEDPGRQDVVGPSQVPLDDISSTWGEAAPAAYAALSSCFGQRLSQPTLLSRLQQVALEQGFPGDLVAAAYQSAQDPNSADASANLFLYELLRADGRLGALRAFLIERPQFFADAAQRVYQGFDQSAAEEGLVALIGLAVRAKPRADDLALLPARYHLFVRALEGLFVSLQDEESQATEQGSRCPRLFLERRLTHVVGDFTTQVLELTCCRRCGQEFLLGQVVSGEELGEGSPQGLYLRPLSDSAPDAAARRAYFVWQPVEEGLIDEDEEVESGAVGTPPSEALQPILVCGRCGLLSPIQGELPCGCKNGGVLLHRIRLDGGQLGRCPACGGQNPHGDVAIRFRTGQDAPVSVLATALYQLIPEPPASVDGWGNALPTGQRRKLLVFSDSRQDAAFFAPYLQRTYDQLFRRRLMVSALEHERFVATPPRLQELVDEVVSRARQAGVFDQRQGPHEWRKQVFTWLMQELVAVDRRNSLEGVGLIDFRLVFPEGYQAPRALQEPPWDLSPHEAIALIETLVDTLRQQSAVAFPSEVSPQDDSFQPRNREFFIRASQANAKRGIYSWLPSQGGHSNRRLDYLLRLLRRKGVRDPLPAALNALKGLWDQAFTHVGGTWQQAGHFPSQSLPREGTVFQLSHAFWEVVPRWRLPSAQCRPLYRCKHCGAITRFNLHSVCPAYRCPGELAVFDAGSDPLFRDNHYRRLYLELDPAAIRVEEHTAQLTSHAASELQKRFMDGQVNVLSCSTTFELGVDVGELQAVLMRNVPPRTANYVQRAGRAGRRTDTTAFALTFAQRRSHDLTHYAAPERFIAGRIAPPHAEIVNPQIAHRHLNSVALAAFFREHPECFGNVERFFLAGEKGSSGPSLLNRYLRLQPQSLHDALCSIVPEALHQELGLDSWTWVDALVGRETSRLDIVADEIRGELDHLEGLAQEAYDRQKGYEGDHLRKTAETIKRRELLGFLGSRNVLPKYGFPVDVVGLHLHHHGAEASRLELDRDLRIALSEYAPGSQVVAGGRLWTSYGLQQVPNRAWLSYAYAVCNSCGRYQRRLAGDMEVTCRSCDADLTLPGAALRGHFIAPEFGFVTGLSVPPRPPGEIRPQRSYSSRVFFAEYGSQGEDVPLEQEGTPAADAGIRLYKRYSRQGKLAVISYGPMQRGFRICETCGYGQPTTAASTKTHQTPWNRECRGLLRPFHLGHEFLSDVLELRFSGQVPSAGHRSFWLSLTYALLEGASQVLGIRRDDIDGCLYPLGGADDSPAVILYDDVPGGAGHVRRIGEALPAVLVAAWDRVRDCECAEETTCYECLRNYRNQWCHDDLRRGPVAAFLERAVAAIQAGVDAPAYVIGVADRGRWLARQIEQADEATLVVPHLQGVDPGDLASGGQDWPEVLRSARSNGCVVLLAIRNWPALEASRHPVDVALLHEMHALLTRGVRIYRWDGVAAPPLWPILLQRGENQRLLRWKRDADWHREGLSVWTGRGDLEALSEPAAVRREAAVLPKLLRVCPELSLEDPVFSRHADLIRVREGDETGLDDLVGKWFTADTVRVEVRDPYLRQQKQLANLADLIDVVAHRCQTPEEKKVTMHVTTAAEGRPRETGGKDEQREGFRELQIYANAHRIDLTYRVLPSSHSEYAGLHDREIRVHEADGHLTQILLGRGLDFFQSRLVGHRRVRTTLPTYIAVFSG